ncbi:protein disulfide isomerase [Penicillium cataractarum]|uniref:Protein disulfide-isomerase n=1 Tax=Penicillium cataractarum TaxID=2100454 RepID=A0A9W9V894_9EURO|nr:protein disulfide isomerase [Penicillium cataractarum]KAJ5371229.1 protein disulfide isomerase [Penicillium cataractarum]
MGQVGTLISLLPLLLVTLTPKAWSKLIEANSDSFNAQSSAYAVSLATFCLSNYKPCDDIRGELKSAAETLQNYNYNASLISIDCGSQADICRELDIISYPTLRIISNGSISRYRGSRDSQSIFSRLIKELNPLVWPLEDGYLEDIKSLSIPALVIHVEENDHLTRQLIQAIAPDFRGSIVMGIVAHSMQDDPVERDLPFVDVYHPMDEVTRTFDGPVDQKTLDDFAQRLSRPLVGRFDPTTSETYEKSKVPLVYICADTDRERKEVAELVRSVATKNHGSLHFATLDTQRYGFHAYQLGLDIDKLPGLVIQDFLGKATFPLDQEEPITAELVDGFISSLF